MDLEITASELRECLDRVTLVDVREPEELEQGLIDGCKPIPLGELMNRAPRELDPDQEIVVYCAHGIRSLHAVIGLQRLGFTNVKSLRGGIEAWLRISTKS